MKRLGIYLIAMLLLLSQALAQGTTGVPVSYQLPTTGTLPQTYLVTLAIVQQDNPNWIISQFVRGEPRTVTAANAGKFTETWDGLDENLMPVPPGSYAVKGIFMPAHQWQVDGEYHAVVPQFVAGASSWMPTRDQLTVPEPFGGDPVGAPLGDVDVAPNGVGVFYYVYLENGLNNPMMDLNKPLGLGQFLRAFGSGGAAGGTSTCTDGETVWSFSTDGGAKYVYRADGKPFGNGRAQRAGIYLPQGWVKALSCQRDTANGQTFVYIAQGGKVVANKNWYYESNTDFFDTVTVHEGNGGKILAEIPLTRPLGIAARGGSLYALHGIDGGYAVEVLPLQAGLPQGTWQRLFTVPADRKPFDIEVDSHQRIYLSFRDANRVVGFDRTGKRLVTIGRLDEQKSGSYDPMTLMAPGKLATWTDATGNDRVVIVEHAGPNRVSEWSPDGKLLREFTSLQTKANDGYTIDPAEPDAIYIAGHERWLTKFKVDYATNTWKVVAVYPHVGDDPKAPGFDHPTFAKINGRSYMACGKGNNVYRLAGDRWLLSAALISEQQKLYSWHDANGDGVVQDVEYRNTPLTLPGQLLRYHGNQWQDDLSLLALNQNGQDVWRLSPSSFDAYGNPVYSSWQKVLTDPVFQARRENTATALNGGNELDDRFSSDWGMVDGTTNGSVYVVARGGKNFSANEGAQIKLSRYEPDGKGGYQLLWRVGRTALQGVAKRGEMYGAIHLWKPLNGLVSIVDQSRCGMLLFTEDGMYVDSIFPDGRKTARSAGGIYPQPGEFFAGYVYPNKVNGRIYFAMGKFTPLLYEAQGWSLTANPVQRLTTVQKEVTITATQIATPPEIALTLRGGAGSAKLARFSPALGGAVLDGSLTGWESCLPVSYQADKDQTVEVRCLYDPEHLYFRWHARLASKFDPKPLQPIERIFSHDRLADTLSVYIQGDANAKPGSAVDGRPGDVRIIFGLFNDGQQLKPVALGMYPSWANAATANPIIYRTIVNTVKFAHVGPVAGAELHYMLDQDGKGFVITAAIPRSAIPGLPTLGSDVRTMMNFEATFGGHNKFWWSNADGSANRETYDEPTEARLYPGSWAPAQFQGLEDGVLVRNWQLCGPFGGPGAELFRGDPGGPMPGTGVDMKAAAHEFYETATYPLDNTVVDLNAIYSGEMVKGYWNKTAMNTQVRWKAATVADLDTRVVCGLGAQVWYGATWVYAPEALTLDFRFYGHPMTTLRWFLNGEKVLDGEMGGGRNQPMTAKTLTLRPGWNQVMFRGYCTGYPPFRAGLAFTGQPEQLWKLRLSATPPAK